MKHKIIHMFVARTIKIMFQSMGKRIFEEIQNAFHFNTVLMGPCTGYYGKCVKACKTQGPEVMTKQKAPFSCLSLWCI